MVFTRIQLDDFTPTLAKLVEQPEMEDLDEREWLAVAVVGVTSMFEYGDLEFLGDQGGNKCDCNDRKR